MSLESSTTQVTNADKFLSGLLNPTTAEVNGYVFAAGATIVSAVVIFSLLRMLSNSEARRNEIDDEIRERQRAASRGGGIAGGW